MTDLTLITTSTNLKGYRITKQSGLVSGYPGEVMTYNISRLNRNNSYFANGILVLFEKGK